MLKVKIKISDIQNLTDARYFAAMDVDYIGFCCNPNSETYCAVSKIKEMVDWISGPQFVLQFQGFQHEDEIQAIVDTGLGNALHFGVFATYEKDFGKPIFKEWIFENVTNGQYLLYDFPIIRSEMAWHEFTDDHKQRLRQLLDLRLGYLDLRWGKNELLEMIDVLPDFGLILRGGEEERIGVKSYDELDAIFEMLQEEG
jgi:phosphoribosylanthranilate isomerase